MFGVLARGVGWGRDVAVTAVCLGRVFCPSGHACQGTGIRRRTAEGTTGNFKAPANSAAAASQKFRDSRRDGYEAPLLQAGVPGARRLGGREAGRRGGLAEDNRRPLSTEIGT